MIRRQERSVVSSLHFASRVVYGWLVIWDHSRFCVAA
jgi:hypothetical protein